MTSEELVEPQRWPASRWWTIIGLVFAAQLGLILWLGQQPHPVQRPEDIPPSVRLAGPGAAQMLALSDPTLFALPHREGFSGPAWLTIRPQEFRPFVWSEPPRWLTLAAGQLGADFGVFMSTNQLDKLPLFAQPELELKLPDIEESHPFPTESTLRLAGGLARRHLVGCPALPSWPSAEILTNTVVQLLVTADGKPFSPKILKPGSGSSEADEQALREARKARFSPVNLEDPLHPMAGLTWGLMVFEWRTLPLTSTNNPSEAGPIK